MTADRASVFGEDLDLSEFTPRPPAKPTEVRAVAEKAGFASREPQPQPLPEPQPVKREQRRYRTGRNVQLSLKVRQGDLDQFYELADGQQIVLGEAFARAVAAWKRELAGS